MNVGVMHGVELLLPLLPRFLEAIRSVDESEKKALFVRLKDGERIVDILKT